jgi:hypothetical protein
LREKEVRDTSFWVSVDSHFGSAHFWGVSRWEWDTSRSNSVPHFVQRYSKRGIAAPQRSLTIPMTPIEEVRNGWFISLVEWDQDFKAGRLLPSPS